ncbi:NAD(P)/FAD-dependent oxidoreductase [Bradyrhizobium lablabi]|uniref:flavin monoamine oxidase family protein n=1 Tax=Bradyrhizobium lablabi TaxID=722472 RepID=UPI001BA90FE3|nr:NAD(P)/FAD-dependent oxidoreductase [Bradyrhizobium lablabi]MBR0697039.1 FAD-dependent oxidoreductase [Bradyrhizobium lablabi]
MTRSNPDRIIVVGGGAAGLMAARELARARRHVTILEARDRCGGRIDPLPVSDFGYPAEGGAEFIHGKAPVTHGLLREAGLSLQPIQGTSWTAEDGKFSRRASQNPHESELQRALAELKVDLSLAEFLTSHFSHPRYEQMRRTIERMVEGYDAADPAKISVAALREEWMDGGRSAQARVAGGYGALIEFLAKACRNHGADIRFGSVVKAVEIVDGQTVIRCADGSSHQSDCTILTAPIPVLSEIDLPPSARVRAAAVADIGFGNVIKILLCFQTRWWIETPLKAADLTFLISEEQIPVWWTQNPNPQPVLTGWFGGPKTAGLAALDEKELIEAGLGSLAKIFGLDPRRLTERMVAARAINWANDPFARGAYSYATPATRAAQLTLAKPADGIIFFAGEALYRGADMGTVEAALDNGIETARAILRR